jgi:hypothetical protein
MKWLKILNDMYAQSCTGKLAIRDEGFPATLSPSRRETVLGHLLPRPSFAFHDHLPDPFTLKQHY